MEVNDTEYLNLFKQIKEQQIIEKNYTYDQLKNNGQMLNETPDYSNFNNFNLNEIKINNYDQSLNLNEFNIETRINGINQNLNEVKRQEKEDKLNEVMQKLREERIKSQEEQSLNESINFDSVDFVTLEMFNKARYNSMMNLAKKCNLK